MPETKSQTPAPIIEESESKFQVYVNNTEVGFTPWDIRLKLREIVDGVGEQPVIRFHGTVVMAPAHAKAFSDALKKTVSMYEEKFGEIDLTKITAAVNPKPTSP